MEVAPRSSAKPPVWRVPVLDQARRVLVVDDDPSIRDWLEVVGARLGYQVTGAASAAEAIEAFSRLRPALVTLDLLLPDQSGLEVLVRLREIDGGVPVIMLSGHGSTRTIVEAVRLGASDFLRKPCEAAEIEQAFEKALCGRPRPRAPLLRGIEGALFASASPKIQVVREVIEHVADTDITVLIRGESGTGKELVAQLIFQNSARSEGPFVKVNCAALPSELLESELFGYEKGAYTGAQRRKLGKFEVASGGTIFLDEVSEMRPRLQAKLLQVLQDGQFSRLGGQSDVSVDARVIAATNRDLERSVREGSFREDLFYRLNVVTVELPPLRERLDEIPLLCAHFLERYAREFGKPALPPSPGLMRAFLEYAWPGNIRELENLVKRMVVLASEEPVVAELDARRVREALRGPTETSTCDLERYVRGEVEGLSLKRIAREAAQAAERRLIERVLERTRWNRREAAEILQISYKALLYKMKDAGLVDRV